MSPKVKGIVSHIMAKTQNLHVSEFEKFVYRLASDGTHAFTQFGLHTVPANYGIPLIPQQKIEPFSGV